MTKYDHHTSAQPVPITWHQLALFSWLLAGLGWRAVWDLELAFFPGVAPSVKVEKLLAGPEDWN